MFQKREGPFHSPVSFEAFSLSALRLIHTIHAHSIQVIYVGLAQLMRTMRCLTQNVVDRCDGVYLLYNLTEETARQIIIRINNALCDIGKVGDVNCNA